MDKHQLTQLIKDKALELGYVDVGITTAEPFEGYREEIDSRPGYDFLRNRKAGTYEMADPKNLMPDAKCIISTIASFSRTAYPSELLPYVGRAYLGREYLARADSPQGFKKARFIAFLEEKGIKVGNKDSEYALSLPDRAAAARAGIITYGRNNFAYSVKHGSFIIITNFLVDADLETVSCKMKSPCPPNCDRCVKACPTGALYAPHKLDPSKCKLYVQIRPLPIEDELLEDLGLSIHGCDLCQEVCPRNKKVLERAVVADPFLDRVAAEFDLAKILLLDDEYYEHYIEPIMYNYIREKWIFKRNAAIAIGNSHDASYLPALHKALSEHDERVEPYIIWAIKQIESSKNSADGDDLGKSSPRAIDEEAIGKAQIN